MERRQCLQEMVLGKFSYMQKNETGPLSYTTHKDKLKMDETPKYETGIHQNPRGEHRQQPLATDFVRSSSLLDASPRARETKAKMNYWDFVIVILIGIALSL